MKITMVQSRGHVDDIGQNFYKARMRVNNVDSDVFVFPEMYCTGYVPEKERYRFDRIEPFVLGPLRRLSDSRGSAIICGCPVEDGDSVRNSLLFIDGQNVTRHDKTMLSSDGVFDENGVFTPGNEPTVVEYGGFKFALGMGEEIYSAELIEWYVEEGVDLIVLCSAFEKTQMEKATKVAIGRATEHSVHIMMVNMVGPDPGAQLAGNSVFIGPDGEIMERCTDSSDVREIRLDKEMFDSAKADRIEREKPELNLG